MNAIIMTIVSIGSILYRISKIICIINVILYVIFMEKFNKNNTIFNTNNIIAQFRDIKAILVNLNVDADTTL